MMEDVGPVDIGDSAVLPDLYRKEKVYLARDSLVLRVKN